MTIAFFNSITTWGGGEKWHYEASVLFAQLSHTVYFFGHPKGEIALKLSAQNEVHFYPVRLSNKSFLNPVKLLKLKKDFEHIRIDVLVINHPGDLKIAAHAAHLAKIPRIIYRRGSAIPIKDRFLNRYIFKNWVTDVLANSLATKQTITALNSRLFPIDKIKVIYNPIDFTQFLEKPYHSIIPKPHHGLQLGSIGRLAVEKNHRFLIDVSKRLNELNISHTLYIAGKGPLEEELKAYRTATNTSHSVVFVGFLENIKDLLMDLDVFILPSLWEGFGYVVAEAAACKKPSIAFRVSSMPELIQDGESGYLVPVNDIDTLVAKILILQDEKTRLQMGEKAWEHCQATFDKTKISLALEAYITKSV